MLRIEQLRRLVQAEPGDPLAHYGLGLELLNLGQWSDAVESFSTAMQIDPDFVAAYFHGARALLHAGRPDEARQFLQRGLELANRTGDAKTADEMRGLLESIP